MNQLTDVAQSLISSDSHHGPLKWVGMENMKAPLKGLLSHPIEASISAFVSLSNPSQRGIHMSRIYELVQNLTEDKLTRQHILNCLNKMTTSQNGSSDAAKLSIKAKPLFERLALKSEKKGFKSYPIEVRAKNISGQNHLTVSVHVDYSSTCPCSAALSREAIALGFSNHFTENEFTLEAAKEFLLNESTWPAWPHAQRSRAYGTFLLNDHQELPDFSHLIDQMEKALSTPTQTAVKRVDEQEFARLNAQNLMFCEDAARRLKTAFQKSDFKDFKFKVRHFESLHSHDVFAEVHK